MAKLPVTLHPVTNPTGYMATASAVYAAAVMIYNALHHHGVIDVPVIIAAVTLASSLLTHQVVTPVALPRDGNGNPLVPAPAAPALPAGSGSAAGVAGAAPSAQP